ncbi:NPR2-domain-containing protein [Cutaneotrichosporon oleaginosum]|uniref:NPR2-domain-containing protein n=1 Tax=Cutaneotrichosporon oleaginosum TaxID=879819 RepID=A0A0J0XRS9_9TREE|nr:NPR2-domain-containing protein [Cutaneotrichosporon oleaginosum]KLT43831.1 NPR2-domain-containing protein [Cutaneotrichosporon oleaginosum]TXT06428.1 hypothetical protein COLE_05759 [Cutaneotrichosporon oleaginosum]
MHGVTDETFLPQIIGVFYATFDPVAGPTVLHQVPEHLISSSTSDDGARSPSGSRSRSVPRDSRSTDRGRDRSRPRMARNASPSPMRISHPQPRSPRDSVTSSLSLSGSPHANGTHSSPLAQPSSTPHARAGTPAPRQPALLDFGSMSEYVIPKKSLHGKLVSFRTSGAWDATGDEPDDASDDGEHRYEYRVIGLPMVLEGEAGRYQRNQYIWNLCFVFRASASLAAFEPVVRKTARILRSAELDTGYLSAPQAHHTPIPAVLEQIFEDLNSYSETSIPLDGYNSLELKLFPYYPNPPECNDWDVPIALVDLKSLRDPNWDITASRVVDHVDGINHCARIAQLADADLALVRETLRHMLFYQVVMIIDIFQYSNLYTVNSSFPRLVADESVIAECGTYVTRPNFPVLDWPALATLYAKLTPGITVHKWCEDNGVLAKGIDPRRFVSFGIIKGFLVRAHRWPVMVDRTAPLLLGPGLGLTGAGSSLLAPDPARRRVGFHSNSRESRDFRNDSGITRALLGGDSRGESQFTLRSGGSAASITGVSPGSAAPNSPPRKLNQNQGRSLGSMPDTHPSVSSRRTNTLRSGGGLSQFTTSAGAGVSQISRQAQGRLYELEDELLGYLDGHHHTDEIQVRMGMSWTQLEKVLGLDEMRDGVGRKGIAMVVK